jgi:TetR/AcrR family transcriptional regulator
VHTILDELHGTALFLDLEALSPAHLKAVIVRRDQFDRGVRKVLEEGMSEGTFGRGDPKLLAFALLGAVNWIPRWFSPEGSRLVAGNRRLFRAVSDRRSARDHAR